MVANIEKLNFTTLSVLVNTQLFTKQLSVSDLNERLHIFIVQVY